MIYCEEVISIMSTQTAKLGFKESATCGDKKKHTRGKRSRSDISLGPNEQRVLLALRNIGHETYGSKINAHIEIRTGEPMKIGALYGTLDRLYEKGFIAHSDPPKPESNSRIRKNRQYFRLTGKGVAALEKSLEIIDLLRSDISASPA